MQPSEREGVPSEEILKIIPNVAFFPFKNADSFNQPKDFANDKEVPWDESYYLYLRSKFDYEGIEGYLDIINEQYKNQHKEAINPYGNARFDVRASEGDPSDVETYYEQPTILRFSFFLKKPRDLVALTNTAISFQGINSIYILLATYSPVIPDILAKLEQGHEVSIVERHFCEIDSFIESVKGVKKGEKVGFNLSYLWFPEKIDYLRKIKLMFEKQGRKDDDGQVEEPPEPPVRERDLVAV